MAAPDISVLKDQTYEACMSAWADYDNDPKMTFRQSDVLDLDVIPNGDLNILLQVVQALLDEKLLKVVHAEGGMGWKLRTRDVAKRYVPCIPMPTLSIGFWHGQQDVNCEETC